MVCRWWCRFVHGLGATTYGRGPGLRRYRWRSEMPRKGAQAGAVGTHRMELSHEKSEGIRLNRYLTSTANRSRSHEEPQPPCAAIPPRSPVARRGRDWSGRVWRSGDHPSGSHESGFPEPRSLSPASHGHIAMRWMCRMAAACLLPAGVRYDQPSGLVHDLRGEALTGAARCCGSSTFFRVPQSQWPPEGDA